ncbi:MAG: CPBP family intramembrane glutamic endopeptidase [Solirubrobacterales bacterium]
MSRASDEQDLAASLPPPSAQPPAPSGGARPGAWGPVRTFAALAIFLVILTFEAGIVSVFDNDLSSLGAKLSLQALLAATLIAVAFVAASPGGGFADPAALGWRRPLRPALGAAILAYVVYVACAVVLSALINPQQEDVTRELGFDEGTVGAIAAGFLIIVAAPLSEEIFFRGLLFGGIRSKAPFAVAAIVSASIWGLFHYTGPGSWGVCLQLAVFGVILAWLYERTGSIWPTLALHVFNNALAVALTT